MFSDKVDGSGIIKKALLRERGELVSSAMSSVVDSIDESASSEPRTGDRRHDGINFLLVRTLAFYSVPSTASIIINITVSSLKRESVLGESRVTRRPRAMLRI